MGTEQLVQTYADISGAIITGSPDDWAISTTEDSMDHLTDEEMTEIATGTIGRHIYLAMRDEYEKLYQLDCDGGGYDYYEEVDRFDHRMTDREKMLLGLYCQEAQDFITSDREAAAFIRACDCVIGGTV